VLADAGGVGINVSEGPLMEELIDERFAPCGDVGHGVQLAVALAVQARRERPISGVGVLERLAIGGLERAEAFKVIALAG
jgi:hypothetical protein